MLGLAIKIVDRLIDLAAALGALALAAIMVVIVVDVIGRYFGAPLYGAQDLVQMAAVFVVFAGMAYCDRRGGHVSVDILASYFSQRLNFLLTLLGHAVGAVIFALIAWYVWEASILANMLNLATNILQLPRAPFQYAVVAFCSLTSLAMVVRIIALLVEGKAKQAEEASV